MRREVSHRSGLPSLLHCLCSIACDQVPRSGARRNKTPYPHSLPPTESHATRHEQLEREFQRREVASSQTTICSPEVRVYVGSSPPETSAPL